MAKYTLLELIGLSAITTLTYLLIKKTLKFLYANYIGHALGRNIPYETYGDWAVVTGATDGIGKAYAEEMAARGLNIVLISRSLTKLQVVANEIESKYRVKTLVIDVDFCAKPEEIYPRIEKQIQGLEIGVLINNVGMSYNHPEFIVELPSASEFSQKLLNCNIVSVVRMTLLVLSQMAKRKKGLIMNVSSASVIIPSPLMTMYSSTKGFVYKFSQDLAMEYAPLGITVQCVMPGWVTTNMSKIRRPNLQAPLPKDYVQSQMKTIGFETASNGYWPHNAEVTYYQFLQFVAPWLLNRIIWSKLTYHMNSGRRYMKKLRDRQLAEQQQPGKKVE